METIKKLYQGFKDDAAIILLVLVLISITNPVQWYIFIVTLAVWGALEYLDIKTNYVDKCHAKLNSIFMKK